MNTQDMYYWDNEEKKILVFNEEQNILPARTIPVHPSLAALWTESGEKILGKDFELQHEVDDAFGNTKIISYEIWNNYPSSDPTLNIVAVPVKAVEVNTDHIKQFDKILNRIDSEAANPDSFVTAKFGVNWRDNALKNYPIETLVDLAWLQGRRALLLEKELLKLLNNNQ